MFSKILIANRGEVAVRVIRACREMGIATVAVYSTADAESLHVSMADEAYCIGGPKLSESYLNVPAILTAAKCTGAEAIHPGYGLLSENAEFAQACIDSGVAFIGPSPEVIARMGDKDEARRTMQAAGVPVIPGTDILPDLSTAEREAVRIGYPLMLKARSGGGGKGIRPVAEPSGFETAFMSARSEARAAFGDDAVYLERFLAPVKHVEVQLLCDREGNVLVLGDRDCSVQRRNQKLIEESPAPTLPEHVRLAMYDAARKAARAVGYVTVGTVEFLVDRNQDFYFMEMNTRLQVEHTVSEMVTDVDIVKWQIRTAAGMPLTMTQEDVRMRGHAIECRICAENPENFVPSTGPVKFLLTPGGLNVRFDTFIYQSYVIPPYYDSMLGKLIVCAATREEALRKMRSALSEFILSGPMHNVDLHLRILSDPAFIEGRYTTSFMAESGYCK